MKRGGDDIDRDPEVGRIAQVLGISGSGLSKKLVRVRRPSCHGPHGPLRDRAASLADVHAVVLDLTRAKVELVKDDDDLERFSKKYAKKQAACSARFRIRVEHRSACVSRRRYRSATSQLHRAGRLRAVNGRIEPGSGNDTSPPTYSSRIRRATKSLVLPPPAKTALPPIF
ncbi:MAG: hypothetical protein SFV15_17600 [Polyangiaceae bacterium]|nr:hypothetical protein [Polyangiaceae bacterium]